MKSVLDLIADGLVGLHWLVAQILPYDSGAAWLLAVAAFAVAVRAVLTPISVHVIKSQRSLQRAQPDISELQQRFEGDRKRLRHEMKAYWARNGTNPLLALVPLFIHGLVFMLFFALFGPDSGDDRSLLDGRAGDSSGRAKILGSWIGATLFDSHGVGFGIALAVLMHFTAACTLVNRLQLSRWRMPPDTIDSGPYAKQQRLFTYAFPVAWICAGLTFPLTGLTFFAIWFTWTLGLQTLVISSETA